jgi:polyisoprenoid-binding protein YceI
MRRCTLTGILRFTRLLICIALAASTATAWAQETWFELDPAKTTVEFSLGATLHSVHGTFKAKAGGIRFDAASGRATGSFVIDAASGNSGNESRDHKMHKEILESAKYPEIGFTPTHVIGAVAAQGDSTVQVEGIFRLHGTDHEITLSVPVHVSGNEVTARLHFEVPYIDWGLKNPNTLFLHVSPQAEIDVSASGHWVAPAVAQ